MGIDTPFLYQQTRAESHMFYETLRAAGGARLARDGLITHEHSMPVMESAFFENNTIGYLRINSMISRYDDIYVHARNYEIYMDFFYENITNASYLIIDLRGNRGGLPSHFYRFVASPLLNHSVRLPALVHYLGGVYTDESIRNFSQTLGGFEHILYRRVVDCKKSLLYLDRGIDFYRSYESALFISANARHNEAVFDGCIFILTDNRTASGAEAAVAIFKYNNVATVVGETTLGIMGTGFDPLRAIISLPNTGILILFDIAYFTDPYGRPLQGYGIQPHYFNRPGMDALETVLAMIGERGASQ
jgi:hypothetical protein